jgi:hypothetical protein
VASNIYQSSFSIMRRKKVKIPWKSLYLSWM